ncbi:MAG: hypothetical protein WCO06_01425 [Candidatus Roizmanbacteria bacterium]
MKKNITTLLFAQKEKYTKQEKKKLIWWAKHEIKEYERFIEHIRKTK